MTAKNLPESFESAQPEKLSAETQQSIISFTADLMKKANKSQAREFGSLCVKDKKKFKQYRNAYGVMKNMNLSANNIENVFTINGTVYYVTMSDRNNNSYELHLQFEQPGGSYKVCGFEEI